MGARSLWASILAMVLGTAGCGLAIDYDPPDPDDDAGIGSGDSGSSGSCTTAADCADDGVFCNGAPTCVGGHCTAGPYPCVDDDPCRVVTCVEDAQSCDDQPMCPGGTCLPDGTCGCSSAMDCPPADACHGATQCAMGRCMPGLPIACPDLNPDDCLVPACDPATGCGEVRDAISGCPDRNPLDCVDFDCSPSGACLPVAHDELCVDGVDCTVDTCLPGSTTGDPVQGCTHRRDDLACGDLSACTHGFCRPEAPLAGSDGCVQVPDDDACAIAISSRVQCGSVVCVGDAALPSYPGLGGCAFTLDSSACLVREHCTIVGSGGTTGATCAPIGTAGSICTRAADCDDGIACNGTEACVPGGAMGMVCARSGATFVCLAGTCMSSWCDLTTGLCASRNVPGPGCPGFGG